MTENQTTSWIFLALAISSQSEPSTFSDISQIADGINHAVPTQKEMQSSLSWLKSENLILKVSGKYSLTEMGNELYTETQNNAKTLSAMWNFIESKFKEFKNVV